MQHLEVSGAVRPIYVSLGVKRLILNNDTRDHELQKLHGDSCQFIIISL